MAGIRGYMPEKFSDNLVQDWKLWRKHFTTVVKLQNLTDEQTRLALVASMSGNARDAVADLGYDQAVNAPDPADAPVVATAAQLLELFEQRFVTAAASEFAISQLEAARQHPQEPLANFHSRLRALWRKAYPDEHSEAQLIRKFQQGCGMLEVRTSISKAKPAAYNDALTAAQDADAVLRMAANADRTRDFAYVHGSAALTGGFNVQPVGSFGSTNAMPQQQQPGVQYAGAFGQPQVAQDNGEPMDLSAMAMKGQKKNTAQATCHFCNQIGHIRPKCELLAKAKIYWDGQEAKSTARRGQNYPSSGRGSRTSYRGGAARGGTSAYRGRGRAQGYGRGGVHGMHEDETAQYNEATGEHDYDPGQDSRHADAEDENQEDFHHGH